MENSNETIIGVYKIENIKNHKVYIGSSKNIYMRWKQHLNMLKTNKHHSAKLQRCYNKLKDKNTLQFSVIEVVDDVSKLKDREQYYINFYDAYNTGYNCCENVDNPKYALKNQNKAKRNKMAKQLYQEFEDIYDDRLFRFPAKIYNRIEDKDYTSTGMRRIICLMKLYLKYFKQLPFTCRIYLNKEYVYLEMWANKNDYISYKLDYDKAIGCFPVTKSDVKMMTWRTDYNHILHTMLKRFPILF